MYTYIFVSVKLNFSHLQNFIQLDFKDLQNLKRMFEFMFQLEKS